MVQDYYGSGGNVSKDILPNLEVLRREKQRSLEKSVAQVIVSFILMVGAFASLVIGNWAFAGLFFLGVAFLVSR